MTTAVITGDCLTVLATMEANSIDAVVTDPPAGISFMGKQWDHHKGGRDAWIAWMAKVAAECLRVVKPGAHALVWALPRTSHWTATAWEDGGWQVRDRVAFLFGSGFPKSLNLGTSFDKIDGMKARGVGFTVAGYTDSAKVPGGAHGPHVPVSEFGKQWDGWGTALKPACEDWWLLRKSLEGTVAANVQKWGTGAINVDACRVEVAPGDYEHPGNADRRPMAVTTFQAAEHGDLKATQAQPHDLGRWPANVVTDGSEEVLAGFPESDGQEAAVGPEFGDKKSVSAYGEFGPRRDFQPREDTGSAARFFYTAKATRADREEGLEAFLPKSGGECTDREDGNAGLNSPRAGAGRGGGRANNHPTVKSTALMRWLIRLITPPGGTVLDCFAGSGSTGKAAVFERCNFIGIEQDAGYAEIARARIAWAETHREPEQLSLLEQPLAPAEWRREREKEEPTP
jgi:hypothetical protein